MLNKITANEYTMLDNYRCWYAWQDDRPSDCNLAPIKEILSEWNTQKTNLYRMLGENLMITRSFEFSKSYEELTREMYNVTNGNGFGRKERSGSQFVSAFYDWYDKTFPLHREVYWLTGRELTAREKEENQRNSKIRNGLSELISNYSLVHNIYNDEEFSIPLPNGKEYMIRNGCKPIRALAKIAEMYELPGFEDFRICHSLVHNQKMIKGDLTLSIHPLDYWTMSDNECGWESCMNWRDFGGYRQGTVEMMNSPYVVVAYLAHSEDMDIGTEHTWNSKKWRQLFIVDKDVILGVKAYPYYNEELSDLTIKWIKELAENNLSWKYTSEDPLRWTESMSFIHPDYAEEGSFYFRFFSNNMYTDVGALDWHPMFVGTELHPSTIPDSYYKEPGRNVYGFNYSGKSECVCCGWLNPHILDESSLCCIECDTTFRCDECDERCSGQSYTVGDAVICADCYFDRTSNCSICEERDFDDNFSYIVIMPKVTDEETIEWLEKTKISQTSAYYSSSGKPINYTIGLFDTRINICGNCSFNFSEKYLKSGCKTFLVQTRYGDLYTCCYYEDLNDKGIKEFDYNNYMKQLNSGKTTQKELLTEYFSDLGWMQIIS